MAASRRSLTASLAGWFATVASLLVVGATLAIHLVVRSYVADGDRRILRDKLAEYAELLANGSHEKPLAQEVAEEATSDSWMSVFVRIGDAAGTTLLQTDGFPSLAGAAPAWGASPTMRWAHTPDGEWRSAGTLLTPSPDGPRRIEVMLVNPQTDALLHRERTASLAAVTIASLAAALCGLLVARRAVAPIRRLGDTVSSIRADRLDERVATGGLPREVAALADQFNVMLGRLEDGFARLDRFSGDIAHELRTPVNNLRVVAEVALARESDGARAEVFVSVLEESQRLTRLIDTLLLLARVEDPQAVMTTEVIALDAEVAVVAAYYEISASDRGIRLEHGPLAGRVRANRTLFQRLLGNLIDNAVAHTAAGGTIRIDGALADGRALVRIADTGEGIPPEHLPHVFDRFRRAARDRSGRVGLGLPIARAIARLHRGDVRLASVPGAGTTAEIELPATTEPLGAR